MGIWRKLKTEHTGDKRGNKIYTREEAKRGGKKLRRRTDRVECVIAGEQDRSPAQAS